MTTKPVFVDLTSRGLCDKFLWAHRNPRNPQAMNPGRTADREQEQECFNVYLQIKGL